MAKLLKKNYHCLNGIKEITIITFIAFLQIQIVITSTDPANNGWDEVKKLRNSDCCLFFCILDDPRHNKYFWTQYCDENIMIFDNLWQQVSINQQKYALNKTQYKVCRCFVKSLPWLVIDNLKPKLSNFAISQYCTWKCLVWQGPI